MLAGYLASRSGAPIESNPYPVETYGGHAWRMGWLIGILPPVVRILIRMVIL